MLLARGLVRLLVIDSVAAPFRCEFPGPDAAPRARLLQALGAALRQLSYTHGSPVLCINQARLQGIGQSEQGVGDPGTMLTSGPCRCQRPWMNRTQLAQQGKCGHFLGARGVPARGVTWACPPCRNSRVLPALGGAWANQLLMRLMADRQREDQGPVAPPSRTLRVVFAPHLPPAACSYSILTEGVRGMARLAPT